jgi:hypothetical protein
MGFLSTVTSLLSEDSDASFEKKMVAALDKIESTLGTALDKAETGLNKVDNAGQKIDQSMKKLDDVAKKIDNVAGTAVDVINKKSTTPD